MIAAQRRNEMAHRLDMILGEGPQESGIEELVCPSENDPQGEALAREFWHLLCDLVAIYRILQTIKKVAEDQEHEFEFRCIPYVPHPRSYRVAANLLASDPVLARKPAGVMLARLLADVLVGLAAQSQVDRIAQRVADEIEERFRGPVLDNYEGYCCVQAMGEGETVLPKDEAGLPQVCPGQAYTLQLCLAPEPVPEARCEKLRITRGREAEVVEFELDLVPDDYVEVGTFDQHLQVRRGQATPPLAIPFSVRNGLRVRRGAETAEIWVRLLQKGYPVSGFAVQMTLSTDKGAK